VGSTALRCLFLAMLLAACGGAPSRQAPGELSGPLNVFAAASLTEAFEEITVAFEQAHPDVDVVLNFGPSSGLAVQITQGAPADVFASANQTQMRVVADAGFLREEPRLFAQNLLEIAVEPGNPLGIMGLRDLARPDVTLVLAAEDVPAGEFAREALRKAGVRATPASLELDVRAVLSKVEVGEADAGIVYVTDVIASAGKVEGIPIPPDQNVPAAYPIASLSNAPNSQAAGAFVEFVLSPDGQNTLSSHGFNTP
jgi:molybdate transport system substrate-binding protein